MHEIEIETMGEQMAGYSWRVRMAGRSDTGRVRGNNEDYLDWDLPRGLALLADGVGGRNAGEVASRMAVTTLLEQLPQLPGETPVCECSRQLRLAIEQANHRIYESAQYAPFHGMSTTLAALWLCGRRVVLAHVGDSRIYRLREGVLRQLTVDHSLVQELVDCGAMSSEEAQHSANRHLITRALGLQAQVVAELVTIEVCAGDRYLLCSDGLSDKLDVATLTTLLLNERSVSAIIESLIEHANLRGGEDNIAALLVAIDEPDN
ncbi:MAG TPA: Stp1/IreP family PP2C-type Ser/Thr phosphatase [Gammaproteobacteria bacterium]